MSDQQVNPRRLRRVDHARAVFYRQRHRFFDQDMLAGAGRDFGMIGMELVRRRDVNRVDRRIGAHFRDAVTGGAAEIGLEPGARLGARVDRRHDVEPRVQGKGRQHHREPPSQPGDAEFQFSARLTAIHCTSRKFGGQSILS